VISFLPLPAIITGCLPEKRIVWSSDGKQALVLTDEATYLMDIQGNLTRALDAPLTIAAWMPDSKGVIGQRMVKVKTWDEAVKLLSKKQTEQVIARGDAILKHLQFERYPKDFASPNDQPLCECVALYLKDHHSKEVPDSFVSLHNWFKRSEFNIGTFARYQANDKKVKLSADLCRTAFPALTMQISPTGGLRCARPSHGSPLRVLETSFIRIAYW
jgi:hypothetical protein